MMKRIGCMGMVLVMLAMLLVPSLTVMAASPVTAAYTPAFSQTSGTPGSETTLTVSMKLSESCVLSGMRLMLEFDADRLVYKNSSAAAKHAAFKDATIYHKESEGRIIVVWTSEDKVKLPTSFELLSVPFTVAPDAAEGSAKVTVKMVELYTSSVQEGQLTINNLQLAGDASTSFQVLPLDLDVKNVVDLIDSIGTVTYPESEESIAAAEAAYATLSDNQKAQIYNASTMEAARTLYEQLKAEAIAAEALEQELEGFKTANKTALELSTDIINNSTDKAGLLEAVNKALEDYKALSAEAQFIMYRPKNNIQAYKTLLEKLIADAEAAAKQEQYKNEAQEYIDQFLKDHNYTLTLTPETIKSFDDKVVEKAWNEYDALILLPDVGIYIKEGLAKEAELLDALRTRLAELKAEENPELSEEILAAEDWKNKFSSVLALDPETIIYDDVFDIMLAKTILDMMDEPVRALLTEEAALLEVLYEKALTLSPEEIIVEVDRVVEVEVKVPGPAGTQTGNVNLGINTRTIGLFVWILLGLALLSTLIFVALRIFWGILIRKEAKANV